MAPCSEAKGMTGKPAALFLKHRSDAIFQRIARSVQVGLIASRRHAGEMLNLAVHRTQGGQNRVSQLIVP